MGPQHAELLEVIFDVLFRMSLEIPVFLRNRKMFAANKEMKQELALVFVEILLIVSDATIHYTKAQRGKQPYSYSLQLVLIRDKRRLCQRLP